MSTKLIRYYNHIVDNLLSDTKYDFNTEIDWVILELPWMKYYLPVSDIRNMLSEVDTMTTKGMSPMISDHIGGKYGVHKEEVVVVLKRFLHILYTNILNDIEKTSLTESEEKIQKYYDYIITDIMNRIRFRVIDSVSNVFVEVSLPFRAPGTKDLDLMVDNVGYRLRNIVFGQYISDMYGSLPSRLGSDGKKEWEVLWDLFILKFKPYLKEKLRELLSPYGYK